MCMSDLPLQVRRELGIGDDENCASKLWRYLTCNLTSIFHFNGSAKPSALMALAASADFFSSTKFPITSTSIWVRRKQSSASSGRQTMGSLSLNDVFSTTGTPVRSPTERKSFQ